MSEAESAGNFTKKGFPWYSTGYIICWVISFLACWVYCIATYGFLLGVGLGWFPSAIAATVISIFWPLVAIGVIWLMLQLSK
jgi:hypothetical protein